MRRLCAAKGKSLIVTMLDEGKKSIDPKLMKINSVMSERQLVEQNGLYYYRIAATDHIWPSPENIDDFIAFIRTLPDHAWLHFHCQAGKGRTTIYMAMYDMMKILIYHWRIFSRANIFLAEITLLMKWISRNRINGKPLIIMRKQL